MRARVAVLGSDEEREFVAATLSATLSVSVELASEAQGPSQPHLWIVGATAALSDKVPRDRCVFLRAAAAPPADESISVTFGDARGLVLAVQLQAQRHRERALVELLAGNVSHDARGAIGVIRLALQLLEADHPATRKVENGLARLSYLLERLPAQCALELGLVDALEVEGGASNQAFGAFTFETLDRYVEHLRRVQSRREVVFKADPFTTSGASAGWVPFLVGFVEAALKIAPARASFVVEVEQQARADAGRLTLTVERGNLGAELGAAFADREVWDAEDILSVGGLFPYRLREAAALAIRAHAQLSLRLDMTHVVGRVEFPAKLSASESPELPAL